MNTLEIWLTAIALAMDSFTVAIAGGLTLKRISAVVAVPFRLGCKENKLLDLRNGLALALPHLGPVLPAVDEECVAVGFPEHAERMEGRLVELHGV